MTQKEKVLNYIQAHGSITPLEAFTQLDVTRLAAVVYDLRADGHEVVTQDVESKNRYGDVARYAKYTMKG